MKVVVDATTLDGRPSGAATRLAALGAALRERGEVELVHLVRPGIDALPGLPCRAFSGTASPLRRAVSGRRLDAVLREERADVFLAGALPLPRVRAAPVVLTVHDARLLERGPHDTLARRAWSAARLAAHLRRPACVVAVSDDTARRLVDARLVPKERVVVVPNAGTPGLDVAPSVDALAGFRRRAGSNARYALALGPLEPHKRPGFLLEALRAARAHADARDLLLVCAGRAEPGRALTVARRAAALGLADAVRVTGELSAGELAAALAGADALVVAGRVEGFCIPVVDAQRLSVPVVAVRAGGLPGVVGEGGLLVDADDAVAFGAALAEAVREGPARDARIARGRELAARWSWEASAAALADVLARVARGG